MQFKVGIYRILLVDDDRAALELFREYLKDEFQVEVTSSAQEALAMLDSERFHLVITDLVMPGIDGLQLIEKIKEKWSEISIIVISGQATVRTAVDAMKAGAEELLMKPVTNLDLLSILIRRVLQKQWLQEENQRLNKLLEHSYTGSNVLGSSREMQDLLTKISKIAPLETTILLTGDTGVGKSFMAQIIHDQSQRKARSFVSVNCGALTETLLESTLFGHNRGAFTGAVKDKIGLFEEASGGTLFLDEVSETSGSFQVKLLNAIERGVIRKVGGEKEISVDVRLIFATNRDLREEVEKGSFRKDLYFRINVINLHIPALRERQEDILMMANVFLGEISKKYKLGKLHLGKAAKQLLKNNEWEGNIRELRNTIEYAAVMCEGSEILPEHLPENYRQEEVGGIEGNLGEGSFKLAKENFERLYFESLLRKNRGNVTMAARESELARQCVYRKLESLGIDPQKHRGSKK
ncbi:MAG: sigma-54 dependent transcriptional regulator [Candidatus Cloacimonetes bacterium]|nr:sigma-54 dependent transcriptional regulator [Candidatus Cloacimonadota bacterium]